MGSVHGNRLVKGSGMPANVLQGPEEKQAAAAGGAALLLLAVLLARRKTGGRNRAGLSETTAQVNTVALYTQLRQAPPPQPDAWDELLEGDDESVPFALAEQQAAAKARADYGIKSTGDNESESTV